MKVLIIYEQIPEATNTYLIEWSAEELQHYNVLAGEYVNGSTMTAEQQRIADELSENLIGKWAACEIINPAELLKTSADAVLLTGIML